MSTALQTKQQVAYGDVLMEMLERNPIPPPPNSTHSNNNPSRQHNNYNNNQNNNGNNTNKRKYGRLDQSERKRPKIVKIDNYHIKIAEKMKVFTTKGKIPRISALCQAANISQNQLFPGKQNFCIKGALFGTCFADCAREHPHITNEEAEQTINLLKPALENPESVKVNRF